MKFGDFVELVDNVAGGVAATDGIDLTAVRNLLDNGDVREQTWHAFSAAMNYGVDSPEYERARGDLLAAVERAELASASHVIFTS